MKARYRWGLIGAFIVQVGLLGWMIADRALLLMNGKEVRLAVVPVDPRDILRGDYVVLAYDISRLTNTDLAGDDAFSWGDPIYVTIAAGADDWQATAISKDKPATGTFLKGTVQNFYNTGACEGIADCSIYEVAYNLEQFFVPEGTGRDLENLRNDQRMSVDVAVAEDGRAALKRLLVDGEVRFEEGLY